MPKAMEESLRHTAQKRGYGKERTNAYVYGTMQNRGMLPRQKKRTGYAASGMLKGR